MGAEYLVLIFLPITVSTVLVLMFGTPNSSPILADIQEIGNLVTGTSRDGCINLYDRCSNDGCNNIINFPCGDIFYVLLVIGSILALPFVIMVIPFLLMVPITSITAFNTTYSIGQFWFVYSPLWAMFGFGVWRTFW